jgi:hypothetical protein
LAIGILGALQGTLFAAQQNATATKLARATSMAAQIRNGLEAQGYTKLTTGMVATSCTPVGGASAALKLLTDGLDAVGNCIIDVDVVDPGIATVADKLVSNYDYTHDYLGNNGPYRRVVVYTPGVVLGDGTRTADTYAVVVSVSETGRRIFVKQFAAIYDSSPAGNGTNITGLNI